MYKESKEPKFKLLKPKLVILSFMIGLILIFLTQGSMDLILFGFFFVSSGLTIVAFSILRFTRKFNKYKVILEKIQQSKIQEIDTFTGEKFEIYLKQLFTLLGFNRISTTQRTKDFGVDLIMYSPDNKKIVVQAKRWNNNVGIDAINEAAGTRLPEKADEVWVVTNSYFTKSAIKHANMNLVKLVDREQLIELILKSQFRMNKKYTK